MLRALGLATLICALGLGVYAQDNVQQPVPPLVPPQPGQKPLPLPGSGDTTSSDRSSADQTDQSGQQGAQSSGQGNNTGQTGQSSDVDYPNVNRALKAGTPGVVKPGDANNPTPTPADTNPVAPDQPYSPPPEGAAPQIATRDYFLSGESNENIRFRPYFSLMGVADNGAVAVQSNGRLTNQFNDGLDVGFGISGRRVFEKDKIELDFTGDITRYTPDRYYDGGNYSLLLHYQHLIKRHLAVTFTENANRFSNNYSLLAAPSDVTTTSQVTGSNVLIAPETQLFNNTTTYLSTGVDVIWQKTARLSFDFGATGFKVQRDSPFLYGTLAAQARADMAYRATRRLTTGLYYSYQNFMYNGTYGMADVHTAGVLLSYKLSRRLDVRIRGGISRLEDAGLTTVTIDPVIAQLLGYSTGIAAAYNLNYLPDVSAQATYTATHSRIFGEFRRSVSPGDGILLTSRDTAFDARYEYAGLRHYTFVVGAGRDQLDSAGFSGGHYSFNSARFAVTRVLADGFQATFMTEYRYFDLSNSPFLKNSVRISLGLVWSPGERPLRLW